jgi:glycosyltransferase involved in cell wall biosynthesis
MEAMACGTPVVSTRVSGIPELVIDGVNGWLADPGDAQGLADALAAVLASPGESRDRSIRARHTIETEFDVAIEARKLLVAIGASAASVPYPADAAAGVGGPGVARPARH